MLNEKEMFIVNWDVFHKPFVKLISLIDEKDYTFKPTPEIFSLKELIFHVINSEEAFFSGILTDSWDFCKYNPEQFKTNIQVLNLAKRVHANSIKAIQKMTNAQLHRIVKTPWNMELPALALLWGMRDHMIHHRGQLYTYARLKGIKPPIFIEMT